MDRKYFPAVSLGLNFAVGMAFFSVLGIWADRKWGKEAGWLTLLGIFAGLLYGAYEVWKIIKQINEPEDPKAKR